VIQVWGWVIRDWNRRAGRNRIESALILDSNLDSLLVARPLRIVHVITRMIVGGAQENTLLCCQDLAREHGDEVLLITGPALGPEGSLMPQVRAGGVAHEITPAMRRAVNPIRDAVAYRQVLRSLRSFRPEVVHTHSAKAGILGRRAARKLGVPVVVHTVHGAPFYAGQGRAERLISRYWERRAARWPDRFISVSDAMTELMVADRVAPPERFTTIYSGMETAPFLAAEEHRSAARARLGYGEGDVVFTKVARLFPLKGHELLIKAARAVVQRIAEARFLLVGDGILRTELQDRIERLGLSERFQFAGLAAPGEIPGYLAASDIVVHASLREGLARVLPQGLLAGRPVVSFDIHGAAEVIADGQTGRLAPAGDSAALAEAMVEVTGDPGYAARVAAARAAIAERFDHRWMTAAIRRLYESELGRAGGRRAAPLSPADSGGRN